jgi:hypothetical protein
MATCKLHIATTKTKEVRYSFPFAFSPALHDFRSISFDPCVTLSRHHPSLISVNKRPLHPPFVKMETCRKALSKATTTRPLNLERSTALLRLDITEILKHMKRACSI